MRWIFPAKVNSSIVPRARARPAPSSWEAYDDDEPELPGRGFSCGAASRRDDPTSQASARRRIAASIRAPALSSSQATSKWPQYAATCNAVIPHSAAS